MSPPPVLAVDACTHTDTHTRRPWVSLRVLLSLLFKTVQASVHVACVMLLVVFVFAVVGMQLFASRLRFDSFTCAPLPRRVCACVCVCLCNLDGGVDVWVRMFPRSSPPLCQTNPLTSRTRSTGRAGTCPTPYPRVKRAR